jgi:hypothetical protein
MLECVSLVTLHTVSTCLCSVLYVLHIMQTRGVFLVYRSNRFLCDASYAKCFHLFHHIRNTPDYLALTPPQGCSTSVVSLFGLFTSHGDIASVQVLSEACLSLWAAGRHRTAHAPAWTPILRKLVAAQQSTAGGGAPAATLTCELSVNARAALLGQPAASSQLATELITL